MASINKKPKVYLVAKTSLDRNGLIAYLKSSNNEDFIETMDQAYNAGLSDMEVLVSTMAKLCYKSLTLGKNDNITRVRDIQSNIASTIYSCHGSVLEHSSLSFIVEDCSRIFTHELVRHRAGTAFCLSGDTVIWSGSKLNGKWNGIKKSWTIKSLFEWSQDKKRKGRIKLIKVRCFDGSEFVPANIKSVTQSGVKPVFLMTLSDGKSIKASSDHRFMAQNNGSEGWYRLGDLKSGNFIATNGKKILVPDRETLELLYIDKGMTRSEIAKKYSVSEALVSKWVQSYGFKKSGSGRFVTGFTPYNKGKKGLHSYSHTEEAKRRQSESKIGNKNPQFKNGITAKRKAARNNRKTYCELCGSTSNLHGHHKDRNHFNDSPENIQTLCNSCHQKLHREEDGPNNALVIKWLEIKSIEYVGDEMTYDLEIDHPSHNFVANGIVTHNSQNSGRYIKLDSIDLVVDPILQPVEDELNEIVNFLENKYAQMSEKLFSEGMGFAQKKKITSALRRIAPNGQTNEIGFSINLRALRFTIQKRTDAAAEWEIRYIFNQVYDLTRNLIPTLFCDEIVEIVDGLKQVKFEHHT